MMSVDMAILIVKGLLVVLAGIFAGGVLVILILDTEIDDREDHNG